MKKYIIQPLRIILIVMTTFMLFHPIVIDALDRHSILGYNSRCLEPVFHTRRLISFDTQQISEIEQYSNYGGLTLIASHSDKLLLYGGPLSPLFDEEIGWHYIAWRFSTYTKPDFCTQRITNFYETQNIKVLGYSATYDRWALVNTLYGETGICLESNLRFIERRKGLFDNKEDDYPVGYIDPQIVTILDQNGEWLLIDTYLGAKWIYLNFMPSTYHLDALLQPFGNTLSVYFYNTETGFEYIYNTAHRYFSASVTKAVFALYIYEKAERGEIDLGSYITFTHADFLGGSGVIWRNYPVGTEFTQRELLRKNLMYSDNVATLMLRRIYGINGYRQFVASLGANPYHVRDNVFDSSITIKEAGIFMRAIHDYIESDGLYGNEFRQHLLNNQYPFLVSDYPVASKTGWTYPYAWHDMAIVYAPSPYILVILSRGRSGESWDYQVFAEISMAFQEFNSTWFTFSKSLEGESDLIDDYLCKFTSLY